jgi:two-component SAPR family response regulator
MVADLRMPFMDAPELAVRIRSINPDMRVLFVSKYDEASMKSVTAQCSHLPKPIHAFDLL